MDLLRPYVKTYLEHLLRPVKCEETICAKVRVKGKEWLVWTDKSVNHS
jgi:hypothetical protein